MNRIVLIGNGFDLAHSLPTRYENFINWYWKQWGDRLLVSSNRTETDELCSFTLNRATGFDMWYVVWSYLYRKSNPLEPWNATDAVNIAKQDRDLCDFTITSPLLERINKSVETKKWVDIENEYYCLLKEYAFSDNSADLVENLNKQLHTLESLLTEYLGSINIQEVCVNKNIRRKVYESIRLDDISVAAQSIVKENVNTWVTQNDAIVIDKIRRYGLSADLYFSTIKEFKDMYRDGKALYTDVPCTYMLPDAVMLLSFNYTQTAQLYYDENLGFINYIHGKIDKPESIIFGYGDEIDDDYKSLQNLNDNECLSNVKTIKYQNSDNYRKVLSFIESAPFQVYVMGHSCGNSDRTLLNTLFEHKNCISIKPFYYIKKDGTDNYLELIQNISRNFTDMKLMRDRVVNKLYCEPLIK